MCGIPDLKIGFQDSETRFFIELTNPQTQPCQVQPRQRRAAPQPPQLPIEQLAAIALPIVVQMFASED